MSKIWITTVNGAVQTEGEILYDIFGLHGYWDSENRVFSDDEWTITHLPTGWAIRQHQTRENALEIIAQIKDAIDWSKFNFQTVPDYKGILGPLLTVKPKP